MIRAQIISRNRLYLNRAPFGDLPLDYAAYYFGKFRNRIILIGNIEGLTGNLTLR